jgi:GT2 family glycosyltransferase
MRRYTLPEGVEPSHIDGRPLLSTPQGGKVALDPILLDLWRFAAGRTLEEIQAGFKAQNATSRIIRASLACLVEAGLLQRSIQEDVRQVESEQVEGPPVAVILVSYNSRDWLEECLPSLARQTYAPIQTIVVDNASQDGTLDWLQRQHPAVKAVPIERAVSLAKAINIGAEQAQEAPYLLMLNPDVTLEPGAVAEMVRAAEREPGCGGVAAKLRFSWAPAFLNGLGNQVGPFSWGSDNAIGHLDLGQFDGWKESPSACFAAALITRQAWQETGPLDEHFPMYYEDSEWSYRARLLGFKIAAAPRAVVFHAFGGRVPSGKPQPLPPRKLRNVIYGRLRFAVKITGGYLPRFLRNYLLEDWANFSQRLFRLDWRAARAFPAAWLGILKDLPALLLERRKLQSGRSVPDEKLFELQASIPAPFNWRGLPELTWELILNHYSPLLHSGRTKPMPEFESDRRRPHVLIVSHDVVDEKMAGPGMRYLEMARALSGPIEVTLAIPNETKLQVSGLNIVRYWEERAGSLQVLVENSNIAIVSSYMVEKFPFLSSTRTRLVVDLYDPTILENLHYYLEEPVERQQTLNRHGIGITNRLLLLGDFFICGNERQRDFWLGFLAANERVNPLTFQQDSSLRRLIDVVGIGFPDRQPQANRKIVRGVHPAVPEDAKIVLWGGGIWNWLDPLTLVKAWPKVLERHPQARLVFLGTRHPNPTVPAHEMAQKTEALAERIGEKDRSIIFFEWISYEDRESLLVEADVGVALHPIHVETRYSIRTRVLDYLWARLPVLVTEGDVTSEWVQEYGIGAVVPEFDEVAAAEALIDILSRPELEWAASFEPLLTRYCWSQVVAPLQRYCLEGGYAPDRAERSAASAPVANSQNSLARALYIWRTAGLKAMLHRTWRHIQWRLSRP